MQMKCQNEVVNKQHATGTRLEGFHAQFKQVPKSENHKTIPAFIGCRCIVGHQCCDLRNNFRIMDNNRKLNCLSTNMKQELSLVQQNIENMSSCRFAQSHPIGNMAANSQLAKSRLFRFHLMKDYSPFSSCRRRLDFSTVNQSDFYNIKQEPTVSVARRNERERNRVKLINMTFATLREHLPYSTENNKSKKMSKVDTLKAAIDYIRYLQTLVDDHDAVSAVLTNNCNIDSCVTFSLPTTQSPLTSPTTTGASSDSSFDGLSAEEEDLLDFASWF